MFKDIKVPLLRTLAPIHFAKILVGFIILFLAAIERFSDVQSALHRVQFLAFLGLSTLFFILFFRSIPSFRSLKHNRWIIGFCVLIY